MKLGTETETAKMKKTKEEEEDFDGRKRCHIWGMKEMMVWYE